MKGWNFETVALIVPSKTKDGCTFDEKTQSEMVELVMCYFAGLFNGATAIPGKGIWRNEAGVSMTETVTRVESWVEPGDVECHLPSLLRFAKRRRIEWIQNEVAVIVGNTYYGVTR